MTMGRCSRTATEYGVWCGVGSVEPGSSAEISIAAAPKRVKVVQERCFRKAGLVKVGEDALHIHLLLHPRSRSPITLLSTAPDRWIENDFFGHGEMIAIHASRGTRRPRR